MNNVCSAVVNSTIMLKFFNFRNCVLFFLLLSLMSCQKEDLTVHAILQNSDTPIYNKSEYSIVDELLYRNQVLYSGSVKNIFPDGKIIFSEYKNGLKHGVEIEILSNRKMRSNKRYIKGLENGLQKIWYPDGTLASTYTMKLGKLNGVFQEYFPVGNLKSTSEYINGEEVKSIHYNLSNSLIANYEIRNGRKYGLNLSAQCMSSVKSDTLSK